MESKVQNNQVRFIFLLAAANFLAAFGGGTVLHQARAIAINQHTYVITKDDGLLAFMLSTTVMVVLLSLLKVTRPKWQRLDNLMNTLNQAKWARLSRLMGGLLSFGGALTSILMALDYRHHWLKHCVKTVSSDCQGSDRCMILFFLLLSVRFSLWFIPRVLRSDVAAGFKQKIGWVELFYSVGMFSGVVIWVIFKSKAPNPNPADAVDNIVYILMCDAFFQCVAGVLDIYSRRGAFVNTSAQAPTATENQAPLPFDKRFYWKVTVAIVAFTFSIQIVALEFRTVLGENIGYWIMGSFYAGTAIGSLLYGQVKTKLDFSNSIGTNAIGFGVMTVTLRGKRRLFSFTRATILAAAPLLLALLANVARLQWWGCGPTTSDTEKICEAGTNWQGYLFVVLIITLIIIAAFFFEWIALAILDLIGTQARATHRPALVAQTFGLMGAGGTVGIALLSRLGIGQVGHLSWLFALVLGVILTNVVVRATPSSAIAPPTLQPEPIE